MRKNKEQQGRVKRRPTWLLLAGIVIRAVHQVGAAVYLASYILPNSVAIPSFYLLLTIISGFLLLITEGARHREMYRELTGVSTAIKLILFGAAFHGLLPAATTVLIAFVIACLSAHAPKNVRHRLLY